MFEDIKKRISGIHKTEKEKGEEEKEEFIELEPTVERERRAKILLRYFDLTEYADIKPILSTLREGFTIALVNMEPLKQEDMDELKRAVSKIKKTTKAMEGEVVGISEDWVVAVPSFVKVYKGKGQEKPEEL